MKLYNDVMTALNRSKKPADPEFPSLDETPIENLPTNMAKMLMGARRKTGEVKVPEIISKSNFCRFRSTIRLALVSSTHPCQGICANGHQDLTSTSEQTQDSTLCAESSQLARKIPPRRGRDLGSMRATVCHRRSFRRCTAAASSGPETRGPSRGQWPSS